MTVYNAVPTEFHVSLKWAMEDPYIVNGCIAGQAPKLIF
jgi:hypothetical protein